MRIVTRNNKKYYKYEKKPLSFGIIAAVVLYIVAILLYIFDIIYAYACGGEAPLMAGGIGVCSIFLNIVSMLFIVFEIYLYKNFQPAIRNMLILQILYFIFWIFII